MANPLYGQNKADDRLDSLENGKLVGVVSVAAGVHLTLIARDSGKLIVMAPNSTEITLPSPAAGMHFSIVQSGDYASAVNLVNQAGSDDDFVGGVFGSTQGENAATDSDKAVAANTKITFSSASLAGDRVHLVSDGTYWYAEAFVSNYAGITFDN
jgi:hypothetical protein